MKKSHHILILLIAITGCHTGTNPAWKGPSGKADPGLTFYKTGGNPVIGEGSADPSARVFNDTVYLYPSHDFSRDNDFWIMKDWKAYSSTDLVNFHDHGVVLTGREISWAREPDHCWAPDCIEKNGRYYFYFPMSDVRGVWKGEIGVATGDSPNGPFKEALGEPLVKAEDRPEGYGGFFYNIDPAAFTDDDGRSYLFWGNGACFVAELGPDMTSFSSEIRQVRIDGHQGYAEGPFVWKRNGTYYLLYSQGGGSASDRLDYATSERVKGPYRYRGTIIAHGKKGNMHGSVFHYNGQWYVAYHDLFPTDKYRKTCIDRIHYRENGDIALAEPSREGVGWYNAGERIEAEDFFESSTNTRCAELLEGGFFLQGLARGDWLHFPHVKLPYDFSGKIRLRFRNPSPAPGKVELVLDGPDGIRVGEMTLPPGNIFPRDTNGSTPGPVQNDLWKTREIAVPPFSGTHDLYLIFSGDTGFRVDIDWILF